MVSIVFMLVYMAVSFDFEWFGMTVSDSVTNGCHVAIQVLVWISTVLTVVSGLVYLKGYWKYIDADK